MRQKRLEFIVGLFMLAGFLAFMVLALKVSSLGHLFGQPGYTITAEFDNIGDLKVRAPVTIAGVKVGEVVMIDLDSDSFKAIVHLKLNSQQDHIPSDSSARILTQGLLGGNYISLTPGFGDDEPGADKYLKQGSQLEDTHQAIILEDLIGQFLFNMNSDKKKS